MAEERRGFEGYPTTHKERKQREQKPRLHLLQELLLKREKGNEERKRGGGGREGERERERERKKP